MRMLNSVRPNGTRDSRFHHNAIAVPGASLDFATSSPEKNGGGDEAAPDDNRFAKFYGTSVNVVEYFALMIGMSAFAISFCTPAAG